MPKVEILGFFTGQMPFLSPQKRVKVLKRSQVIVAHRAK